MNPSSTVVASVVIIGATTMLRRKHDEKDFHALETIVFSFLLLIALLVLAIVAPSVAQVFAYLGIVGAFALNGPTVFTLLGDFGRGKGAL